MPVGNGSAVRRKSAGGICPRSRVSIPICPAGACFQRNGRELHMYCKFWYSVPCGARLRKKEYCFA